MFFLLDYRDSLNETNRFEREFASYTHLLGDDPSDTSDHIAYGLELLIVADYRVFERYDYPLDPAVG